MNWLERRMGFQEGTYVHTKEKLAVGGERLKSKANGRSYRIGQFKMISLVELRERAAGAADFAGHPRVSIVAGGVRAVHQASEYVGALF